MSSRTRAREQALQVLYLIDLSSIAPKEALQFFQMNFENHEDDLPFVEKLVCGVTEKRESLDSLIEETSENWKISRMPRIDRNILRLGAFQLIHCKDIPPAVAMDESIELAKRFGEDRTPAFVNGLLDRIFKEHVRSV